MPDSASYYSFLVGCFALEGESRAGQLARQIDSLTWDWEKLIRAAAGEKILPALQGRLTKLGLDRAQPPEVADFFIGLAELSLDRNREILSETVAIASRWNAIGIEPVLLKGGAYLVYGIYPDTAARYLADIDFLVAPSDLPRAIAALRAAGYASESPSPLSQTMHHSPAMRRPGGAAVELHHQLGLGPCESILSADEMLAASLPFELHGARLRLPCPEHLAIHHIMHSQVHHEYPERIWPSLRSMYDLLLIDRRFRPRIDWPSVEFRFRNVRQRGALLLHLALVRDLLGLHTALEAPMNTSLQLRWWRRQTLRKAPALRWVDPRYLTASTFGWRARLLGEVAGRPGGLEYLLRTPFRATFYRHLRQETITLPHDYVLGE